MKPATAIYKTQTFNTSDTTKPEDWGLAVCSDYAKSGAWEYQQLWQRFVNMGWAEQHGHKCLFTSYLLRRIMRIHGFPAAVKQVWMQYQKPERGWSTTVGRPGDDTPGDQLSIDTHAVVVSDGWILDFSQINIHRGYGQLAPKAFIVKHEFSTMQMVNFYGKVRYYERPDHFETNNERVLIREKILDLTHQYFQHYRVKDW